MKRSVRSSLIAAGSTLLLAASGVAWYALSPPPVENLALAPELISIHSAEGQRLLAASAHKTDYAQLEPHLVAQARRAFCGPATSAAVINAALRPQPPATQASLFNAATAAVKSELELSLRGLTLEEIAAFLRAQGLQVLAVHANGADPTALRDTARVALAESRTFLVVNYDRKLLKQAGAGHISPVGAFDPVSDRLLVLDVARQKYPYTWVPVSKLWDAMNTVDIDSGKTRGYLLVSAGGPP
jgi:hypothetical protein